MKEKEPVEKKICRACLIEKNILRFPKLPSGNRGGVCNLCKSLGNRIKNKDTQKVVKKDIPLHLAYTQKTDYIKSYSFLKKIGYTLDEENTIHEQFCLKYGFVPSVPKQVFPNHYSPKDLGMI